MAKKYITDKLSAKTASSGITYDGDAVFNGGPSGTFSFDFNNGTTNEFSVNFQGDDFLTVNGGTGVFEVGDIAGLFDRYYLKVDGSNNFLSWKYGQDDLVTFGENSTVSLYGTGSNNTSGAELRIFKGQSSEVTGKLKLDSTNQYLDLEYQDPVATNSFKLYGDYSYTSVPIRIGTNAAANELDDYEEGVYNIKFNVIPESSTGGAYNQDAANFTTFNNYSRYTKVGQLVTLHIALEYRLPTWNTYTSWYVTLANLPFPLVQPNTTDAARGAGGTYSFTGNYITNLAPQVFIIKNLGFSNYGSYIAFNGGFTSQYPLNRMIGLTGAQFPSERFYYSSLPNWLTGTVSYYTTA